MNIMLARQVWVFVGINLDDPQSVFHLSIHLLQDSRHHLTGAAPGCVEVYQHGQVGFCDHFLKGAELLFNCHRSTNSSI